MQILENNGDNDIFLILAGIPIRTRHRKTRDKKIDNPYTSNEGWTDLGSLNDFTLNNPYIWL